MASSSHPPSSAGHVLFSANVMLIGNSQSGKSTLINRFWSLAVGDNIQKPPAVGKGTGPCTTDSFVYEYDVPYTPYVLLDAHNAEIEVSEDDDGVLSHRFSKIEALRAEPEHRHAPLARPRLIDTPGLNDPRGRDVENIMSVLTYLAKLATDEDPDRRHISAVFFVSRMTQSYSHAYQVNYHYYRRCMPNLFGALAMVNTGFALYELRSNYSNREVNPGRHTGLGGLVGKGRSGDTKPFVLQQKTARIHDFREVAPLEKTSHFFIDSKPSKHDPVAQLLSFNAVYKMLTHLRASGRVPIANMHLAKTEAMQAVDVCLAGYLDRARAQWEARQAHMLSERSFAEQSAAAWDKQRTEAQAQVDALRADLARWGTADNYDINTYPTHDEADDLDRLAKAVTFRHFKNSMTIREAVFPFQVSAPDSSDGVWTYKSGPDALAKTWRGRYRGRKNKVPTLVARSFTTNRVFYKAQIDDAKSRLAHLEGTIRRATAQVAKATARLQAEGGGGGGGGGGGQDPEVEQLSRWMGQALKFAEALRSPEMPMTQSLSRGDRARYGKTVDQVSVADLYAFLDDEDGRLTNAVRILDLEPGRAQGQEAAST